MATLSYLEPFLLLSSPTARGQFTGNRGKSHSLSLSCVTLVNDRLLIKITLGMTPTRLVNFMIYILDCLVFNFFIICVQRAKHALVLLPIFFLIFV